MAKAKKKFKSGFVTFLGRPNAGKSTLMNALLGNKISIISPIPQTTRHQVKGILNLESAQIVFVDTPGIHSFKDKLTEHLNTVAIRALEGCDLIVYVADVSRAPGAEEERLMRLLSSQSTKIIMALNKLDLGARFLNTYIETWRKNLKESAPDSLLYFMPLSAKTGKGVGQLRDVILEQLPEGMPYYETATLTDFPLKFRVADIVREKLYGFLRQELPHSLAVETSEIRDKKNVCYVKIVIYVLRQSQKAIVVGKGGQALKEVGATAREDIESIVGKKVFLDIWVEVLADWPTRPRILKELGYWWA